MEKPFYIPPMLQQWITNASINMIRVWLFQSIFFFRFKLLVNTQSAFWEFNAQNEKNGVTRCAFVKRIEHRFFSFIYSSAIGKYKPHTPTKPTDQQQFNVWLFVCVRRINDEKWKTPEPDEMAAKIQQKTESPLFNLWFNAKLLNSFVHSYARQVMVYVLTWVVHTQYSAECSGKRRSMHSKWPMGNWNQNLSLACCMAWLMIMTSGMSNRIAWLLSSCINLSNSLLLRDSHFYPRNWIDPIKLSHKM